ncbi:hypothetical protein KSX68_15715 [Bacteroides caccae]|uniref:hypothetical protein n=1 Tax=Bacteroides caccae TaxID=47678 RepID=UPI001C37C1A9|nr:hypothetical protein [Bacteroides caccae]MBV3650377.1 hypothetical protein [Bacteroides caccae]MBV3674517.1 hypothetical protein [Bacteroides caccae]MBV3681767.1 hypothetical protein [Bacteroides caccae]MBV3699812.1 hypothetical protein [Bacteroides caccae]MBV3704079.1 hypothetical protein [Bacteroides caccae]
MASSSCGTLVRVSNGSFHEIQSAMPRTAGVSGNVPVGKGYKNAGSRWTARKLEECILLGYSLLGGKIVTEIVTYSSLSRL